MCARNTLVQLLAAYTNPESQNAQRYRQTDRQTDRQQAAANSRSYCVAVRSAKNGFSQTKCSSCPLEKNVNFSETSRERIIMLAS